MTALKREHLFGKVTNGKVILNDIGKTVEKAWRWMGNHYDHLTLDEFVVMPNHMHAIVFFGRDEGGVSRNTPSPKPLGRVIGAFKTVSTKRVNQERGTPGKKLWQEDFWDHIVRNKSDLERIREYIRDNPRKWQIEIDS